MERAELPCVRKCEQDMWDELATLIAMFRETRPAFEDADILRLYTQNYAITDTDETDPRSQARLLMCCLVTCASCVNIRPGLNRAFSNCHVLFSAVVHATGRQDPGGHCVWCT